MEKVILSEKATRSTIMRLSYEIVEKNPSAKTVCLIGIRRRGASLAKMICQNINKIGDCNALCGEVDISLYRDDLSEKTQQPIVNETAVDFPVENQTVVLVDDVLYTGRTIRSAIDNIFDMGRPSCIQLVELIDRGHRQLPFKADYVGKNVPTSESEQIDVQFEDVDGITQVLLIKEDK